MVISWNGAVTVMRTGAVSLVEKYVASRIFV
jgi:hypothetical protein